MIAEHAAIATLLEIAVSATTRAAALEALWSILDAPDGHETLRSRASAQTVSQAATGQKSSRSAVKAVPRTGFAGGGPGVPLSPGMAYKLVRRGIPSRSLAPLGEYLGLGKGAVAEYLDLDRATVQRKVAKDEPLPTHAAESMLRLLELDRLAEEVLASPEEAAAWLSRAHPMLDGETPLECAKSAFGAQRVKDILVALKYGGVV
jgi:putative toxin-antitoxin system antitoxin component (TIGR02293 family)